MSRSFVTLREAALDDAPGIAGLWAEHLRRADRAGQLDDVRRLIAEASVSPEMRIIVAEYDGRFAGAVYVRVATLSPINFEPAVQVLVPSVVPEWRRKGVGRQLMEAATAFAEQRGAAHLVTAAESGSRDGNRFMARLGFGPNAVYRVAPTQVVRAKLAALLPAARRPAGRAPLGQVLAARRSMRRSQAVG